MAIAENLMAAVAGGAVTLGGREAIRYYRRPRLSLGLQEVRGEKPFIVKREMENDVIDSQTTQQKIAKDIHVEVTNKGYRPALGCEATVDIFENGEEIPKPIRLGWRKRPPLLYENQNFGETVRQRTAPFDINRKSKAQLDLLRLRYQLLEDNGKVVDRNVEKLTMLSSFRSHDFEKDTKYEFEVTVTSSNADPETIRLQLDWNGGIEDNDLQDAISIIR